MKRTMLYRGFAVVGMTANITRRINILFSHLFKLIISTEKTAFKIRCVQAYLGKSCRSVTMVFHNNVVVTAQKRYHLNRFISNG